MRGRVTRMICLPSLSFATVWRWSLMNDARGIVCVVIYVCVECFADDGIFGKNRAFGKLFYLAKLQIVDSERKKNLIPAIPGDEKPAL